MIILLLLVLGLVLGSFVNALVWRIYESGVELEKKKPNNKYLDQLSISHGRSICTHCKHKLVAKDLVPVLSWLSLGGRCRYCKKPISWQYPLVELITATSFGLSYVWWPTELHGLQLAIFGLWLIILTILIALTVYDIRWMILPNRLVYPLTGVAAVFALLQVLNSPVPGRVVINTLLATIIGGGIFYILFQVSDGKWIGGGDVKLGWALGLIVGTPARSLLFIMLASLLGTVVSLPLMATKKLGKTSIIPFGPFLMAGAIITVFFGSKLIDLYTSTLIK